MRKNARATSSIAALQTRSPLLTATATGQAAGVIAPKQHHVVAANKDATRNIQMQGLIMAGPSFLDG